MADTKQTAGKSAAVKNPRKAALEVLMRCAGMNGGADGYSNLLVDGAIRKNGFDDRDAALMTRLVFGVIERKITLDYIISKLSSRPLAKLDPDVLNLLRMGIYQLRFTDKVPEHAAVNETVNLAKQSTRGFVNAILRGYLRSRDSLSFPDRNGNKPEYLSVTYSVSKEICAEYIKVFGFERAENILAASLEEPAMTLRANTLKCSRDELISKLAEEGFETEKTGFSPFGVRLLNKSGIPECVHNGFAFVQDEASQICALVLDSKPGESIIDVCACPGSKSFSAAICMENTGSVTACDIHKSKLSLVESGAKKLGITIIKTAERDASVTDTEGADKYDRVICDVPCSGFGVMAKKPEIRYKSLKEARKLPELQYSILSASAELVKKGGVIVYSTCTVLPDENQNNVEKFLAAHPDFAPADFEAGELHSQKGMLTLTPENGCDGFFIAKLVRKQ